MTKRLKYTKDILTHMLNNNPLQSGKKAPSGVEPMNGFAPNNNVHSK